MIRMSLSCPPKEVEENAPSIDGHAYKLGSTLDSGGNHHDDCTEEHHVPSPKDIRDNWVEQPENGAGGL